MAKDRACFKCGYRPAPERLRRSSSTAKGDAVLEHRLCGRCSAALSRFLLGEKPKPLDLRGFLAKVGGPVEEA